ncbi:MAG: hypothetical protein ACREYF_19770 [Gammaproteobacteria bacterium]
MEQRTLWVVRVVLACVGLLTAGSTALAASWAHMQLKQAAATLTNTSDTAWTLTKTGSLDGATVTWEAVATEGATTTGLLLVNGVFRVENKGTAGATIGNIVVSLQTKNPATNKWVTRSSNVADATDDDGALSVNTADGGYTENAASGPLLFTDADTNSTFALVPQVTIAPGTIQKLRFSSTFGNQVLNLAVGTQVRTAIIVTFGNARATGQSAPNVDINGNGSIDADEAWVQSVDGRITTTVPTPTPSNELVTLIDTVQDITTTGTVTFSNPQISINFPTALVTVDYDGGTDGGTITNCAHLTSSGQTTNVVGDDFNNLAPVDLTACDTQVIGPHVCSPGAPGCGWADGDMITYNQDNWGTTITTAGLLLANYFDFVYPGGVAIGLSGNGFSAVFTSADVVSAYQPASGPSGTFDNDLIDPISTSAGIFGGYALAVQLDVDFGDAHHLDGAAGYLFGDLRVCGLTATPGLNGSTVRGALDAINQGLGGGTTPYSIDDLAQLAFDLAQSFESGAASLFAQDHLFNGPCPCTPGTVGCGWTDGDMVTYGQNLWGDQTSVAGQLLGVYFDSVYFTVGGVLEVGGIFTMTFQSASAVWGYQPSAGTPAPLNANLVDPTSSASGQFGGEVVALKLNVDFNDAGHVGGAANVPFGNLTLCAFAPPNDSLNGTLVRSFLATANTALGGGATTIPIADLNSIAINLNGSFESGAVNLFAQDHEFNGACP